MSTEWFARHKFPISLPGEPLDPLSPKFDETFIRLRPIYDELDSYLENIKEHHGKFWISSPYGGTGKSTMLSYVARYLYKQLPKQRAIPIRVKVTKGEHEKAKMPSVQHQFVKSLLKEFLRMNSDLRKAAAILNLEYPEDINRELRWLDKHKDGIRKFSETLADISVEKLTEKFEEILESGLLPLREKNVFSKYVLLVDEMDKITVEEEVLSFLSGNQGLFERLYSIYGFVAFFAGHESWVERIKIGDEYNFFLGKTFSVPLFVNIDDVRRLIEVNMLQNFSIQASDIPFTEEAYRKLQELTRGIPRRIIVLATHVMNEGAFRKVPRIGPGFVEEVVVSEEHSDRALRYLQKHIETYVKLKRAMEKRVDEALYVFYNNFGHQIPKKLDRDLSARTRTLGIELSDDEWNDKVLTLTFIGCLEDHGTQRELSKDVIGLFDELRDHPSVMDKVLAAVIRKTGDLKLDFGEMAKPDFKNVIDSIFEISGKAWFSKDQVLDRFSDRSPVLTYASLKHRKSPLDYIREEFAKAFESYLGQNENDPKLITVSENGEMFYRRLPPNAREQDRIVLKLDSRELIDEYFDLIVEIKDCDKNTVARVDEFLERVMDLLSPQKSTEKGVLRTVKRNQLFRDLDFPPELKNRINHYLSETKGTCPSVGIVRETTSDICRSLFERYVMFKSTAPIRELTMSRGEPFTNLQKLYELIGNLKGTIEVLDKDFDAEGFKFFLKLDENKVTALKILGSKSRFGSTLKEEYKAFRQELQKRGISVEFRIPDDRDAVDFHDRYLISDEVVYGTPPWNIINKKYGDVKSLVSGYQKRKEFAYCWGRATDILRTVA